MRLETSHLQEIFKKTSLPKPALGWVLMNVPLVNQAVTSLCNRGSVASDEMIFDLTCEAYWLNRWHCLICDEDFQKWGRQIRHSLKEFSKVLFDDSERWKDTNSVIPSVFKDSAKEITQAYADIFTDKYGIHLLEGND